MNAEIVTVGTELLLGNIVNTDMQILARRLSDLGISLLHESTVGDNRERLHDALRLALSRSDLVITTGGLGPTGDDLTKETIAEAAGRKLVMHEESMQHILSYFKGRVMGETQEKQALIPEGAVVFKNSVGTAPGCAVETNGKIIIMLPGPPSELGPMFENEAVPYLMQKTQGVILSHNIRVFGKGEGQVAEMISDFTDSANPTAATYAKEGEMFVRVTARAETAEKAEELCKPVIEAIAGRLGDVVYGIDADNLEQVVVRELSARGMHLATAESCTGGLVAKRITDIPGSSAVFEMGVVTYSNEKKTQLLGVPEELLREYGAVSEQTARAMAQGVRRLAGSDFGIGITGIAGPDGGTEEKPVGLVYIALDDGTSCEVRKMNRPGRTRGRDSNRNMAASTALDMVRRRLQSK